MTTTLDSLKQFTAVVSDSGDFEGIAQYKPQDATTNPSLILAAVKQEKYAKLLKPAIEYAKGKANTKEEIASLAQDRLLVEFGQEILKLVPGRVSTEIDASLSFDTQRTINKALQIIKLYEELGTSKDRVLIKIASTFDGIQAARILEKEHGVHCNLTLLFGFGQAVACAEAGVTLISPFVGRILDWYKAATGKEYTSAEDPGVASVKKIYTYYKQHGYKTVVMGASFRNTGEIAELAGIDFLTISPKLLEELKSSTTPLTRKLSPEQAKAAETIPKVSFVDNRAAFELALFEEQMAFDKLFSGIRSFATDAKALQGLIADQL